MKSPLSWVGGKAYNAKAIVALFPAHNHFVVVFGGGLHVFFAKFPIMLETVNDINQDLINFWIVCRDNTDDLIRKLDSTPYSRALFETWSKEEKPADEVEWAARWFFLQCSHFSAVYHGGWSYSKERSTVGVPPAPQFRRRTERITQIMDRLQGVQIECSDFRVMLERYGDGPDNLLYLDPPYPGAGAFYEHLLTESDHVELASMANAATAKIALSYPNDEKWGPVLRDLYGNWIRHDFSVVMHSARVPKGAKKPRAREVLLTNYELQPDFFRENAPSADCYPENWNEIAKAVKDEAGWKCERCNHKHDPKTDHVLTVHHLIPHKALCEAWNLAALCQKCHLSVQGRLNMFQDDFFPLETWLLPHYEGFRRWWGDSGQVGEKEI